MRCALTALGSGSLLLLSASIAHADLTSVDEPPAPARWYDWIDVGGFVDAYASVNYAFPKPQYAANAFRSYDASNGFSLSWAGIDLHHDPEPIGGEISLRFGPSALVHGNSCLSSDVALNPCDTEVGLAFLTRANVAYRPLRELTLRFGKFATPFGAETAESQHNINYTRGLLYRHAYPLFHTGLAADLEITTALGVSALLANGWNDSIDNNLGKSVGLAAKLRPLDGLELRLGWLFGPEQDDVVQVSCPAGTSYSPASGTCAQDPTATTAHLDSVDQGGANKPEAWRHLFDVSIEARPVEELFLVLSADYVFEGVKSTLATDEPVEVERFYGAMFGARLELSPIWAVAVRGEYFADPEGRSTGVPLLELASGTLTIDAWLSDVLLFRLENRADFELADHDVFASGTRDSADTQVTTTLGVVVATP